MRARFEKDLQSFSEISKEELESEKTPDEELDDLSKVINWHLEKAAERQHTGVETQREIYDIQKEKQRIMLRLKERLACLDNPECHNEKGEGERLAKFDGNKNSFAYEDDNGQEQLATFGELITDMDWGVNYHLDEKSAPRPTVKKYLVENAKKELLELLDKQIIKSEAGGDIAHEWRRQAYRKVEEVRASGVSKEKWGFVSEIIVKNFLKKMSIDQDAPFQIREADVFQDVEQKIDFIIHRTEKQRGVNVETDDKATDVGIQFSVNPGVAEKKRHQVESAKRKLKKAGEHIDDIVLVIFPLTIANTLRANWQKNGRKAGGPDKFLHRNMAEKIFRNLMRDVFTPEEINTYWEKAKNNFPEK